MVPNINPRGHSFKGVTQYLMTAKNGGEVRQRVGNTYTENLSTDDIFAASRRMAWVDTNRLSIREANGGSGAGRSASAGNTYHYSLSWQPEQNPTWEDMREAAQESVEAQGLEEHQYFMVEHVDEPQKHLHVVINLVHPTEGKIHNCWHDRKVADRWAYEYEKERGEVVCEDRAKKYETWEEQLENGEEPRAFEDKKNKRDLTAEITECYKSSDCGKSFVVALESRNLLLAVGRRNSFSVVDDRGEVHGLTRNVVLEKGKKTPAKTVNAKLKDVDKETLRKADDLRAEIQARIEQEKAEKEKIETEGVAEGFNDASEDRAVGKEEDLPGGYDAQQAETDRQNELLDAAEKHAAEVSKRAVGKEKSGDREGVDDGREEVVLKNEKDALRARTDAEEKHKLRIAAFERRVAEKTEKSRAKWQVDELEKKRDQAFEDLESLSGFWVRTVFQRPAYREAYDNYQNSENQLQERTARFKADVEAYNSKRPEFRVREELEKQGIDPDLGMPSRDEEARFGAVGKRMEELRDKLKEQEVEEISHSSPPLPMTDLEKAEQHEDVPIPVDGNSVPVNDNLDHGEGLDFEEQRKLALEQEMLAKLERDRQEDLEEDMGLGM